MAVSGTATARVAAVDDATGSGVAVCPAGTGVLGGGMAATLACSGSGTGGLTPPASLHLTGGYPPPGGGWAVGAGTGKEPVSGGITTAIAICAGTGSATVTTVSATVPGPLDAGASAAATASCPAGTVLVGGGARTDAPSNPDAVPALHLIASFSSTGGGSPLRSGSAQAWTATAQNGGMPSPGAATTAYAQCATPAGY
ncbi:MAG: hypothetical protein ACRDJU_09825 [Actinomycetota bacterium]